MKWQSQLTVNDTQYTYIDLAKVAKAGADLSRLPYSIRVLLESVARHQTRKLQRIITIFSELAGRNPYWCRAIQRNQSGSFCKTLLGYPQSLIWLPCGMRWSALGGAAEDINPEIPVTLVVDHSVQVNKAGTPGAIAFNTGRLNAMQDAINS